MSDIILFGLIGLVTSFLSNISGGGGALILLPTLIKFGLSPLDAIGTIKIGTLGLVAGSAFSTRSKNVVRHDHLVPMLVIVAIASIVGSFAALQLDNPTVKII